MQDRQDLHMFFLLLSFLVKAYSFRLVEDRSAKLRDNTVVLLKYMLQFVVCDMESILCTSFLARIYYIYIIQLHENKDCIH